MKKVIPQVFLMVSALALQNCRPEQEEGLKDYDITVNSQKAAADSSGYHSPKPVDPDPPVKDGQDWKHQ